MSASFFCINCKTPIDAAFKACPYCGEPITDFLRKYLLDPIDGKYRILSRLGIGGMGEVYKVLHVHLNTVRVVKLMRSTLKDSDAELRFVREARLATRIHHPNVATLFDFSMLDGRTDYMVWEFIEGTNLAELLRTGGPVAPRDCARICIQALSGLEAVHRSGIVHRDISPENIMITEDDEGNERVKIIDLGIAKQLGDAAEDQTKTGMFVGKWKYCSPEHFGFLEAGTSIDARADIYSFGVVLYELLTGRPPFLAQSPQQYVMLHTGESPFSLAEVNPDLEGLDELESLVFRAIEKQRSDRYQSAREFRLALEAVVDALPERRQNERLPLIPLTPKMAPIAGPESVTIASLSDVDTGLPGPPPPGTEPSDNQDSSRQLSNPYPLVTRSATQREPIEPHLSRVIEVTDDIPLGFRASALTVTLDQSQDSEPTEGQPAKASQAVFALGVPPESRIIKLAAASLLAMAILIALVVTLRQGSLPTLANDANVIGVGRSATLGINAYPWAEITRITAGDSGENMIDSMLVTPASIELPPGTYTIEARNPDTQERVLQTVQLAPGESNALMLKMDEPINRPFPSFIEAMQ